MAWMDATSPLPRVMSAASNQLKHKLWLLPDRCSGTTTVKPCRSANTDQPVARSNAPPR